MVSAPGVRTVGRGKEGRADLAIHQLGLLPGPWLLLLLVNDLAHCIHSFTDTTAEVAFGLL